ncbi:hypothetical protein Ac2012v2_000234 [Leucoagaricus gongylophorus]
MDVRDLRFADGTFDVAVDKGTMDAMMTAKGSVWDPPGQVVRDCNKEVDETLRQSTQERGCLHLLDIWTATLSAAVLDETRYDTGNQDTWRGLSLLFVHPTQS